MLTLAVASQAAFVPFPYAGSYYAGYPSYAGYPYAGYPYAAAFPASYTAQSAAFAYAPAAAPAAYFDDGQYKASAHFAAAAPFTAEG